MPIRSTRRYAELVAAEPGNGDADRLWAPAPLPAGAS
jgi:hypothetical protein